MATPLVHVMSILALLYLTEYLLNQVARRVQSGWNLRMVTLLQACVVLNRSVEKYG